MVGSRLGPASATNNKRNNDINDLPVLLGIDDGRRSNGSNKNNDDDGGAANDGSEQHSTASSSSSSLPSSSSKSSPSPKEGRRPLPQRRPPPSSHPRPDDDDDVVDDVVVGLRHVAFICDGNSRWAKRRNLPTVLGHRRGADRLAQLVDRLAQGTTSTATSKSTTNDQRRQRQQPPPSLEYVTLYGFSTENWGRPPNEVRDVFRVMELAARSMTWRHHQRRRQPKTKPQETRNDARRPIRVKILGDLDDGRIPEGARTALRELERVTSSSCRTEEPTDDDEDHDDNSNDDHDNTTTPLTVCLAINYGGRQDITDACRRIAEQVEDGSLKPEQVTPRLVSEHLVTASMPEPDMVVRTGGERRLSNFLLWDSAYSELYVTDVLWPDFDGRCWDDAARWYSARKRRYGSRPHQRDDVDEGYDDDHDDAYAYEDEDENDDTVS